MSNVIDDQYNRCVGCNTCVQLCPSSCITMEINSEGFRYPKIHENLCINCDLCRKRCPVNHKDKDERNFETQVFGAINRDEEIRLKSSSGGAFSALADRVLQNDGVVVGASFNEEMELHQTTITDIDYLESLRGSKYLQSDTKDTFSEVRNLLKNGQHVLYVGTPCQIAGLNSYLSEKNENLVTCDLICKGVPSPGLFRDYLNGIENAASVKVKEYHFRDKTNGWSQPTVRILFNSGKEELRPFKKESFTVGFSRNITLRPSCYTCQFSRIPRVADITFADFWGVENHYRDIFDRTGVSLVLINSQKGRKLFDECMDKMRVREVDIEKALENNRNATSSVKKPKKRDNFFRDYETKGYRSVEKKYLSPLPLPYRAIKKAKFLVVEHCGTILKN